MNMQEEEFDCILLHYNALSGDLMTALIYKGNKNYFRCYMVIDDALSWP